jgi:hypothetical protein
VLEHGFALAASRQTASYNEFRLALIAVRDKAEVLSRKLRCRLVMKLFERSPNSIAPYRLPSRHPLAGDENRTQRGNARVGSRDTPTPTKSATGNRSEIKQRQEALLVAYLVRLAR